MNANLSLNIESLFGPSSEPIDLPTFLKSSTVFQEPEDQEIFPIEVAEECSVADIRISLHDVWDNPTLSGYLIKDHDRTVSSLHALSQKSSKSTKKNHLPDPGTLSVEIATLQQTLNKVPLDSFRLNTDAVLFMRTPKNSDLNVLQKVKSTPSSSAILEDQDALITISVHSKVSWGPSYVTRLSQHVFMSSQTLHDIYKVIPCVSKQLPFEAGMLEEGSGCCIYIDGIVYGSGGENDYADKLFRQVVISGKKSSKSSIIKADSSLKNTKLTSLLLRINEPYWLIHHGNCEHFLVVDQIRLAHPSDPRSSCPLTLHITPPLLDLCRACTKIPASWSVVGDSRLGESPCVLCGPCWRNMGESEEDGVTVLPLPGYSFSSESL